MIFQEKQAFTAFFYRIFIISVFGSNSCTNHTNCHKCSHWYEFESDILILLEEFDEFRNNMIDAIDIMKQYDGVITDDDLLLHSTLQYYCCYSFDDYIRIAEILDDYKWKPFNLTFSTAVCNLGGDGISSWNSIIVRLDDEGQTRMYNFVKGIENALISAGIPIHTPRSQQEPFHSTLGVVTGDYPIDKVLQEINQKIPIFNKKPMKIDSFFSFFPPHYWYSS